MRNDEFARAFGDAPDSFELAMRRALLQDRKTAPRRIGGRALLIAALVALLAFSAAFAATRGFGLIAMMNERFKTTDEVEPMLQSAVPQQGGGLSKFDAAIEQVICDGSKVYFTLRISPKPGEKILIMESEMESFPNSEVPGSSETYEEKAEREGKQLYYAYMRSAWTGEYKVSNPNFISREIDGDSLVYAHSADCIPDEDGKLTLSVEVSAYDAATHTGPEDIEKAVISADIEYTSDMQSFRWKNPAKIKKLGIQITDLRVTDTPMSRSVQLSYKPLPGLSKAAVAKVNGNHIYFFDEAGNQIESADGGSVYKKGDTFTQWDILPADATGAIRIGGLEWLDYDTTKSIGVVTLYTKDAKLANTAEDIEKKRAAAKKEAEDQARIEAEIEREAKATPRPMPSDLPQIRTTGSEMPLLRAHPTEYSGMAAELEKIAAPVELSFESGDYTLTIHQICASKHNMLLTYTIKGKKPIERGGDPSSDGWWAAPEQRPFFAVTFGGERQGWAENELSSRWDGEQFFLDDHTVTGVAPLDGYEDAYEIPEKGWITLRCFLESADMNTYGEGENFYIDLMLDRTPSIGNGTLEKALDIFSPYPDYPDYPDLGVRLDGISMSPMGNTLSIRQDVIGRGFEDYLIQDDAGRYLPRQHTQSSLIRGTPERPATYVHAIRFTGGLQSKWLKLIPISWPTEQDAYYWVPLGAPMPYTVTHANGLKTTIQELTLSTSGMTVRYETDQTGGRPTFELTSKQTDKPIGDGPSGISTQFEDALDIKTNIRTNHQTWIAMDGAKLDERVPQETLDAMQYLRIRTLDCAPNFDAAITIPLN